MCYIERHTCVCDHGNNQKLMLMRIVVCPLPIDCPRRNDPAERSVIRCEDFHRGPNPIFRYQCAVCRTDDLPPDIDLQDSITYSEIYLDAAQRRAFTFMDLDYLTEFQHLAKTRQSGRRYFVQVDYRSGYMDGADEYAAEVYQTGKFFVLQQDGRLVSRDEQRGREIRRREDPSPKLFDSERRRDYEAEEAEACADELQSDDLYDLNNDPEGGRTVV